MIHPHPIHFQMAMQRLAWGRGHERLGWRYAVELDEETIVVPELFDLPPLLADDEAVCTLPPPRRFAAFAVGGEAHVA